jgi:hypothetical protein
MKPSSITKSRELSTLATTIEKIVRETIPKAFTTEKAETVAENAPSDSIESTSQQTDSHSTFQEPVTNFQPISTEVPTIAATNTEITSTSYSTSSTTGTTSISTTISITSSTASSTSTTTATTTTPTTTTPTTTTPTTTLSPGVLPFNFSSLAYYLY